jgi:hypothetical protein
VIRLLRSGAFLLAIAAMCGGATASAQPASASSSTTQSAESPKGAGTDFWFMGGGSFSTIRGSCQTCEEDSPYRHSGGVVANAGYRVTSRMDAGLEVFWMPMDTAEGRIHNTHVDAVAQFRPWASKGFFVKGGAGMAFVRNWVDLIGPESFDQKALSVMIGTGWVFRPHARIGLEVFAAQHAAAIGDLQSASGQIPDVMGNFWSLGGGIVIR